MVRRELLRASNHEDGRIGQPSRRRNAGRSTADDEDVELTHRRAPRRDD